MITKAIPDAVKPFVEYTVNGTDVHPNDLESILPEDPVSSKIVMQFKTLTNVLRTAWLGVVQWQTEGSRIVRPRYSPSSDTKPSSSYT